MYLEKITSSEQWLEFRSLLSAYVASLNRDLGFQNIQNELENPATCYVAGFLCRDDSGEVKGCVAYKDLGDDICELKRLYVDPHFRHQGAGQSLLNIAINSARAQGFSWMYLDTVKPLQAALKLYLERGFTEIAPYYDNPMPDVIYLGLRLSGLVTKTQQQRLSKQLRFCLEIDKEKKIVRQTYLADGSRKENDAEHAWHMAVMALILSEHANNEDLDLLRTISMLLIHDLVEVYAGDTFAYDEQAKTSQREREVKAAERLFALLPADQEKKMHDLWEEFEDWQTPEACFAHSLDNFQPAMLNAASDGRAWREHGVKLAQIMRRNARSSDGSLLLWQYAYENFVMPHLERGHIKKD